MACWSVCRRAPVTATPLDQVVNRTKPLDPSLLELARTLSR